MHKDQSGFSPIHIIIVLVVLGSLAGVSYQFLKERSAQSATAKTPTASVTTPTAATKPLDTVKMTEYKNTEFGFSFQYPSTWKSVADFGYTGRGANEGNITVTSPSGAVITFAANLGGKGGGCGDPDPTDRPHHTSICSTLEILKITPVQPAGVSGYPINLYQYRFTGAGASAISEYGMYVDSGKYAATTTRSTIGALFPFSIMNNGNGNIESHTSGGDRSSPAYFQSQQAKDTEEVLKTFRLL